MRTFDRIDASISYRLNILGIRVWRDRCQLIARAGGDDWVSLGPMRALPIHIPLNPASIVEIASDPLALTAYQYNMERPGSDLCAVLAQTKKIPSPIDEPTEIFPESAD